jgi:hypothetical protein
MLSGPAIYVCGPLQLSDWLLVRDDWFIRCHECEDEDRRGGIAPYERLVWRNAAHTICRRHRTPLVLGIASQRGEGREDERPTDLTVLERDLIAQLIRFEAQIEGAWRGRAPEDAAGTRTANEFLRVVQDLLTFAVERWDTDASDSVRAIDRQANEMGSHTRILFAHRRMKRFSLSGFICFSSTLFDLRIAHRQITQPFVDRPDLGLKVGQQRGHGGEITGMTRDLNISTKLT